AANQNLIGFATGANLDRLADLLGHTRHTATKAATTVRFSASAPVGAEVVIPAGTRVAAGSRVFLTTVTDSIEVGQTSVDIVCEAEAVGSEYNALVAGQINQIVD